MNKAEFQIDPDSETDTDTEEEKETDMKTETVTEGDINDKLAHHRGHGLVNIGWKWIRKI